jgi:perosamine synthetase
MLKVFEPIITKQDISQVLKSLKKVDISGSFNKTIEKFENNFSKFIGVKYSVTTSSGTTALHLSISILNLPKNSEIILSSCTNIATALAITHNNCIPVPIDSDLSTWNIDVDKIEEAINKNTKAIIAVHFLGNPIKMKKLIYLKKKYNLYLIEDAAEAHGAMYNNKMIGSFGDLSCFSFYANKIITTGEGGMVCTNNSKLNKKLLLYKNLGFTEPRFVHYIQGYNFRLTGIQAALGLGQLKNIKKIVLDKIKIAELYMRLLKNIPGIEFIKKEKNTKHVYWMFGIRVTEKFKMTKNQLRNFLAKNKIETRNFFYSMRNQPCLKMTLRRNSPKTPNSNILWGQGLYLPSSHNLKSNEIIKICGLIKKANSL